MIEKIVTLNQGRGLPTTQTDFQPQAWGILRRNSPSQFQIQAKEPGIRNFVVVNSEAVGLDIPKICNVGATPHSLISVTGADTGLLPFASTLYYVYISNSQATFAPLSLRLSATSPTNGYLDNSGNANNWRWVGAVKVDASVSVTSDVNVCSSSPDSQFFASSLSSDFVKSSGVAGYYTLLSVPDIVVVPSTFILAFAQLYASYSVLAVEIGQRLLINGLFKDKGSTYQDASLSYYAVPCTGFENFSSINITEIKSEYKYDGAAALTVIAISDASNVTTLKFMRTVS